MEKDTAPVKATFSAAGIVAVVMMGSWCGPALGSIGIDIACDASERPLREAAIAATPALVAHTETALAEILDDDSATLPAMPEAVTKSKVEPADEAGTAEDAALQDSDTPMMITRLPGVSDTVLPSFRRQMYRTDI